MWFAGLINANAVAKRVDYANRVGCFDISVQSFASNVGLGAQLVNKPCIAFRAVAQLAAHLVDEIMQSESLKFDASLLVLLNLSICREFDSPLLN